MKMAVYMAGDRQSRRACVWRVTASFLLVMWQRLRPSSSSVPNAFVPSFSSSRNQPSGSPTKNSPNSRSSPSQINHCSTYIMKTPHLVTIVLVVAMFCTRACSKFVAKDPPPPPPPLLYIPPFRVPVEFSLNAEETVRLPEPKYPSNASVGC